MQYQFGCASHSLEGDAQLLSALTADWTSYAVDGDYACDYRFVLHDTAEIPVKGSGWSWKKTDGLFDVTYCVHHRPQFRLTYGQGNTVDVYAAASHMHHFQIGVQYATMLSAADRCIGLHGVTVLCGDQVVILSAPSGTGKTTLSNLLCRYTHAAVINGDFALLSVDDTGSLIFEPTPFCGSSGINRNVRLHVDRIVFLEQASENRITPMSAREAYINLMSNSFIPAWDMKLTHKIEEHIFRIVDHIPIDRYAFSPYPMAAGKLYDYMKTNHTKEN